MNNVGTKYEIDATQLDVFLAEAQDSRVVIKRLNVEIIVDVLTGLIVGIRIVPEPASSGGGQGQVE